MNMDFEICQEIKEIKEQKKRENELKEMEIALSIIDKYNDNDDFKEYIDFFNDFVIGYEMRMIEWLESWKRRKKI